MERVDSFRKCEKEGCTNLGDVNKVINNRVYRAKLCTRHKREKYGMSKKSNSPSSNLKSSEKFKMRGHCDSCSCCGWKGPCDIHRPVAQGPYNLENMISLCPNCHRMVHRGYYEFKENKWIKKEYEGFINVTKSKYK